MAKGVFPLRTAMTLSTPLHGASTYQVVAGGEMQRRAVLPATQPTLLELQRHMGQLGKPRGIYAEYSVEGVSCCALVNSGFPITLGFYPSQSGESSQSSQRPTLILLLVHRYTHQNAG